MLQPLSIDYERSFVKRNVPLQTLTNVIQQVTACRTVLTQWGAITVHVKNFSNPIRLTGKVA